MKRLLTIAAVLAGFLLALPLYGQSRGGVHSSGAGRSMGAAPVRGGGFSSFRAASPPIRTSSARPAPSGSSFYRRPGPGGGANWHRPVFSYGWPWWYGNRGNYFSYPLYPYYYPLFGGDDSGSYQQAPAAAAPEQDNGVSDQVAELTNQVQMLQEEQATRDYLRPPAAETRAASSQEKPLSTVLVYRDGHQLEVQNYALMGDTVWVLGDQTTRKIPLNDLDLDVTQKLNADRGVEFVASNTR
jgi:hypothetical protein